MGGKGGQCKKYIVIISITLTGTHSQCICIAVGSVAVEIANVSN